MAETHEVKEQFAVMPFDHLSQIDDISLAQAVTVYQQSFLRPPYNESFTPSEAVEALEYVLDKGGHVILGKLGQEIVSLAGGYYKDTGRYYIEELAVNPKFQGYGLGRLTLEGLIVAAEDSGATELEIRTNANNTKAISLYTSEGFDLHQVTEVVSSRRDNGRIALDERVHLSKKLKEKNMESPSKLKRVVVAFPSGNTTAVVFDQMLDTDRKLLNDKIMDAWKVNEDKPEIEQCCFITKAKDDTAIGKVEMFGGEFCGNATRTAVWLLTGGKDYAGKIESSGVDYPLDFVVKDGTVTVDMPLPETDQQTQEVDEGIIVQLDGIAHLVVTDKSKVSNKPAVQLLRELIDRNGYNLLEQPAFGVSYYDKETHSSEFGVYVRDVDTIFDETACGSGTSCIGIALSAESGGSVEADVIQPTGQVIKTIAEYNSATQRVAKSKISGTVSILYDGEYPIS